MVNSVVYQSTIDAQTHLGEAVNSGSLNVQANGMETLMDAFATFDMDGRIKQCNESFRTMLGYEPGDLKELRNQDITPEKWHAFEARIIEQQVILRGWSDVYEKEYRSKDGSVLPVELRVNLLRDSSGDPCGMWAIVRDISRRVRAEEALRQSEARYREFVEGTNDLVTQVDGEGRFLYVNRTATTVFGCPADECVGRLAFDFVHPDDRVRTRAAFHEWIRNRLSFTTFENRSLSLTGQAHNLLWSINLHYDCSGLAQINSIARDITQRKRAEEELRESESFLRTLVDNVPFEFWARDREGRCTMQNAAITKHWGDILGRRPEDSALSPEELASWNSNNRRAFSGETVQQEVAYTTGGEKRIFHEIIAPVHVGEEIRGILGFNIDITARKQAEEALRRSKEFSEQLIRTANVMVVGLDEAGCIHIFNQAAEKLTGYTQAETMGQNWFNFMLPKNVKEKVWAEFLRLRTSEKRDVFENTILTKTGEERLISWQNSQIMEKGRVTGVISFGIDVTQQKEAEQRLREREEILRYIVRHDPNAIAVLDLDLRYIAVSGRFLNDYNVTEEDVLGKRHYDIFPELPQEWKEVHLRCLAGAVEGNPDDHFERPDGSVTYNRWECRPWYRSNGQIGGIVMYTEVTTERKRAELALRKAKAELEQANLELEHKVHERTAKLQETVAELEQFSYSITHDLRAPLRAIQGFAGLLKEESANILPASSMDHLRRIIGSTQRMDQLVQDTLNYGKILLGNIPLEAVDAANLIREIIRSDDAFQPPQAEVTLEGGLPLVRGHASGLAQCVSNLLRNALKFVAPGVTPRVRIWGEIGKDGVKIWFEDNGIGIAKENQHLIFDMFQQLDRRYEGTGIGLAIVRKAMERMEGKVGVESEPGHGSRFWLFLKRAEKPED